MKHPTPGFSLFIHQLPATALVLLMLVVHAKAVAEQPSSPQAGAPLNTDQGSAEVQQRAGYGQLHRDFGYPGSIRAWERRMYLNPRHTSRGYSYPSLYDSYYDSYFMPYSYSRAYRHRGGENRVYRESYEPNYEAYELRMDHAYDMGVAPAAVQGRVAMQAERALTEYHDVMRAGHEAFHRAQYSQAARYFLLASQLNHGDPSSRLCAAHAQVALGQYTSAAGLVHRAFDLQPKLAYLPLNIVDSYGRANDFTGHLNALREAVGNSRNGNLWFLLGYYYYNSGRNDLAGSALMMACRLSPDDRIVNRFAAAAAGTSP